ncbi:PAS domain S-box protein [Pedobacter sp. AW31-3R]|uniref:sensor histidine kinase n=1 Tax=Pedobacter sp. AW31-3R TaxID=3445781 RepID=UPI003FA061DA
MQTKLELYEKVTPLAQLGIWERNLLTGAVYWNAVIRQIYEVESHDTFTLNQTLDFFLDKEGVKNLIEKASQTGENQIGEFLIKTAKGTVKWVKSRIHSTRKDEKCVLLYGTLEDITSSVNMINALEEKEERFRQAFDYAPIGIALVSYSGHWIRVNNSLRSMLGYEEEEFMNKTFLDFTHPDDLEPDLSYMNQLLRNEINSYTVEKRYFHKNGQVIWGVLSVTLVRNHLGDPLYFISQIKNITDRKKYMEDLILERQRLDNIIKSTGVGTWEWNIRSDKVVCNEKTATLLGYEEPPDTMEACLNLIHPADREENSLHLQQYLRQESKFYSTECRMRHRNGTWLWIEIRGKIIEWAAPGVPLFMLGTFADIHERKSIEQERKRSMEVISSQNERLLNFAHIVSHNLRSHTGNIQMLLDMVITEEDAEEKNKMLQMLVTNANNLQQTLSHLNEVVDIQSRNIENKKNLFLREEIEKILKVLSPSISQIKARVEVDVDPDMAIPYHQAYMESILLNLLTNCIKYREPSRQLEIQIRAYNVDETTVLEVQDNGVGINLKLHGHKLFGMYKTFHGNEDARGMGLFLVKNQIAAMGGKITAESEPGSGTLFRIILNSTLNE